MKFKIVKILLLLLGISSLFLAYKDTQNGSAIRRGVDVQKNQNPNLFTAEVYKKVGFGIFLVGVAFFIKPKDK